MNKTSSNLPLLPLPRWLIDRKESPQNIEQLLLQSEESLYKDADSVTAVEDLPHHDDRTWFVNCDRGTAETWLSEKKVGTFLIRPSTQQGSYALSIA